MCCLYARITHARGKIHRRDKSHARAEAKDALYFNPEMYTHSISCRIPRRYVSHNKLFRRRS